MAIMKYISVLFCVIASVYGGQAPPCEDLSTAACTLFAASKPDLCTDPSLSGTCRRFCGLCPLVCYDCPTAVNSSSDCNGTKACGQGEVCMMKEHTIPDGTKEYIMTCELKTTCDGMSFGFHNVIGKRELIPSRNKRDISRDKRDLNFHCCDVDRCNYPPEFLTTTPMPTLLTSPTTTVPTTTLKPLHNCSRDIVFVLDGSTSIGLYNHNFIRMFVQSVIRSLHIGAAESLVSTVEYSNAARVEWYLTDHMTSPDLQEAAKSIPYVRGTTATHAAFWLVQNSVLTARHGDRPNAKNVVIIITDGGTDLPDQATSEAKHLVDGGSQIIAIGIGKQINTHEFDEYIQGTGNYFTLDNYNSLQAVVSSVVQLLCK